MYLCNSTHHTMDRSLQRSSTPLYCSQIYFHCICHTRKFNGASALSSTDKRPTILDRAYVSRGGSDCTIISCACFISWQQCDSYYKLEEATRRTLYADSNKPFQRRKDGRSTFLALISQYASADKWELEIKKKSNLLHTHKWKGQTNSPLERLVQLHRNAFVSM